MSVLPLPAEIPVAPPAPGSQFGWAAAWLGVAALGFFILFPNWPGVVNSDLSGQRTVGIVLFTPIIALGMTVLCVVRGIWAVGAMGHYRSRWSEDEQRLAERKRLAEQPSTPFIVFALFLAVPWLAGVLALLLFLPSLSGNPDGLALAVMLVALVAMAWIPILRAGLRRRAVASA
jgi:hypothetical protein